MKLLIFTVLFQEISWENNNYEYFTNTQQHKYEIQQYM